MRRLTKGARAYLLALVESMIEAQWQEKKRRELINILRNEHARWCR
jgi:hypothetical protein